MRQLSNAAYKKFNWRPVTPTVFQKEPFDENVEGLSYDWDKSCVDQRFEGDFLEAKVAGLRRSPVRE